MQKILILVVVASIATAAAIVGLNVAQVAHANTCKTVAKSGNPHVPDPDTGIVPKGNPHDFESGLTNGNPHCTA